MGMEVQLVENIGPLLPDPIRKQEDINKIYTPDVEDKLGYVFDTIRLIKKKLANEVPLIGFAGAPWTLLCYMVEGKGSKTFDQVKRFCYTNPQAAHTVLQLITDTTIAYTRAQVEAGTNTIQLFDSWAGLLGPDDFATISLPYIRQVVAALKDSVPVIVFAKGAWHSLQALEETGASGLGIDWNVTPAMARALTSGHITMQGNFDPAKLYLSIPEIEQEVKKDAGTFW